MGGDGARARAGGGACDPVGGSVGAAAGGIRRTGGKHGAPSFERIEELFDACEAVAFSVPPDVQADLAARAARA